MLVESSIEEGDMCCLDLLDTRGVDLEYMRQPEADAGSEHAS